MNHEEEKLAIKISKTLKGLCPSFVRHDQGEIEWHKCNCKATNGVCTCVWRLTDNCIAGKWAKLSFVKDYINKKTIKQNEELAKAIIAANTSNSNEQGVDDRFEILDL